MSLKSVIAGCGSYLPEKIITNDDLSRIVDTTDEWIRERTGIRERRVAADGQYTSDLAVEAARRALDDAGLKPADIDLVIVATTTPDLTFPATAAIVQAKLGVEQGAAFDIQAVCTGFVYALATGDRFVASGLHKRALIIGAETFSRILDWSDRATCVLFGDGAGAFVLEGVEESETDGRGIMSAYLRSDGRLVDLLYVDGGVSSTQTAGHVRMQGNKVFREAVTRISEAMETVAARAGVAPTDIDWFVPHQANERIIQGVVKKLDLRPDQVISTIAGQGNTSAASIPLAYRQGVEDGRIKRGDLVMIEAMGGGLTWGAALLRA
ncbi:beta-ketoacyl-ACP synthase III [Amphiplicatus metriothermophilus]|uniref:Beta-ketoacyl-[acyl-carrier-protein] synthase III n=1 Tax=Amphiplicatus metriothermophilus TaxID=1519374 RepID=A0A239PQK4_9PROT|nr:beta-ketoacyl-ACP synthase III [Amphiplicatus metriothermophilus]MBB5518840.1 3-oxoacyl-[acyl-carrier-protein] synthase-3 [Amphiplicatus metriothermophilus]SNT72007.1 3-oxoacyl-[acyl-carrier-protein] synthase-3 [Amphiplicatus metriothermophilus]